MSNYVKLTQIEHILHRPDMYVGSTRSKTILDYTCKSKIYEEETNPEREEETEISISKEEISVSPALVRIYIEALSNAVDNVERSAGTSTPSKKIKIQLGPREISIYNDGMVIPISEHPVEGGYNHSLLFGSLLTGSNYDDAEARTTSGRNGLGIKLCFVPHTLVRTESGAIKQIQDIQIGERLMGQNGSGCTVLNRCTGSGRLYEITQEHGLSYTVNGEHILCLEMPSHGVPIWNARQKSWDIEWLDEGGLIQRRRFATLDTYTCPLCQKQLSPRSVRDHNSMLHGIDLDFPSFKPSMATVSMQKTRCMEFARLLPQNKQTKLSVNAFRSLPQRIRAKFSGYTVDPVTFVRPTDEPALSTEEAYLMGLHLIDEGLLSIQAIYGSMQVRLALLAGLLDSRSVHCCKRTGIVQVQFNPQEICVPSQLLSIARSLGYLSVLMDTPFTGKVVTLHGHSKFHIPCKKCQIPVRFYSRERMGTGTITIRALDEPGPFVGIQVEGGMFALADYTAVHNCNIFSHSFTVEGVDPASPAGPRYFQQSWSANMSQTKGPVVRPATIKKGYTKVTWVADLARLGVSAEEYPTSVLRLFTRYALDAAMLVGRRGVGVWVNGSELKCTSLISYVRLFPQVNEQELLYLKSDQSEAVLIPSTRAGFESVSFVNGIYTSRGGRHVESWAETLFRPIVEKFNGGGKTKEKSASKITIADVRKFYRLFVVATVVNPEFNGQEKEYLESPAVLTAATPKQILTILKWPSTISALDQLSRSKEVSQVKKIERSVKKTTIDNYDPANKAGTKASGECSLFITEGLSAKTYVVAGIQKGLYGKSGRDWNGVLPIRGKLLNVREKSASAALENTIIGNMVQALGLQYGLDYTQEDAYRSLYYGRLVLVADGDVDGVHIESLCINFIHSLYPTLIQRKTPFIVSLKTPIVRVRNAPRLKTPDLLFYDEQKFQQWLKEQTSGGTKTYSEIKYYKGLGTTKLEDVPDTFGVKIVEYQEDPACTVTMLKAFHKDQTDERKHWVGEYVPGSPSKFSLDDVPDTITRMAISDFIQYELVKYSHANCQRSLPSAIDGLKTSQRKILYAVFKRGLKYSGKSMKVAQLAGYTAEHSNYHHGENNLSETIMGMAYDFVGSNNIPLLYRDGAMGTRLEMGADASSPRYVFTKLDALTAYIYRDADTCLLEQVNDDGDLVEPYFYVPILPMILVNGAKGIGTGWSTTVPCYNPLDVVDAVWRWLEGETELPPYEPWYRSFTGTIEKTPKTNGKYTTWGNCAVQRKPNKTLLYISELPIGMATSTFVGICEKLRLAKTINKITNYSTVYKVDFILEVSPNTDVDALRQALHLQTHISCGNMVALDHRQKIVKFDSFQAIVFGYCEIRFEYYKRRKAYQLEQCRSELSFQRNKLRFIREVMSKELPMMEQSERWVYGELTQRKYDSDPRRAFQQKHKPILDQHEETQADSSENSTSFETSFDYLLRLPMRSFTSEKLKELEKDIARIQAELEHLQSTTEKQMWLKELDEFVGAYKKWIAVQNPDPIKGFSRMS